MCNLVIILVCDTLEPQNETALKLTTTKLKLREGGGKIEMFPRGIMKRGRKKLAVIYPFSAQGSYHTTIHLIHVSRYFVIKYAFSCATVDSTHFPIQR